MSLAGQLVLFIFHQNTSAWLNLFKSFLDWTRNLACLGWTALKIDRVGLENSARRILG